MQTEEEEHGSLSGEAQPALKRAHRKQPKRFQKKRVASAAAPKSAGDNKGISGDDKGIAGDDKGIAGDDKGVAAGDKSNAGDDRGVADKTAAASKRSGALAHNPASAAGEILWRLPKLRILQAKSVSYLGW